ncbi:MAG: hypothetical protein CEN90_262 [Parcubacteria group bacterium Licking1014_17]|nr:MAG: hypothetical protein CEN90_262 [Parcubacteria group bacterium Licking1014_17]
MEKTKVDWKVIKSFFFEAMLKGWVDGFEVKPDYLGLYEISHTNQEGTLLLKDKWHAPGDKFFGSTRIWVRNGDWVLI